MYVKEECRKNGLRKGEKPVVALICHIWFWYLSLCVHCPMQSSRAASRCLERDTSGGGSKSCRCGRRSGTAVEGRPFYGENGLIPKFLERFLTRSFLQCVDLERGCGLMCKEGALPPGVNRRANLSFPFPVHSCLWPPSWISSSTSLPSHLNPPRVISYYCPPPLV